MKRVLVMTALMALTACGGADPPHRLGAELAALKSTAPYGDKSSPFTPLPGGKGYRDPSGYTAGPIALPPGHAHDDEEKGTSTEDLAENALDAIEDMQTCMRETGRSAEDCAGDAVWGGICHYLGTAADEATESLGLPFEAVCKGEPPLKCCNPNGDASSGGCFSAFNSEKPINCEGNQVFGATAKSYGPCIGVPGSSGCTCDYIPFCSNSVVDAPHPYTFNQFLINVAAGVTQRLGGPDFRTPDGFIEWQTGGRLSVRSLGGNTTAPPLSHSGYLSKFGDAYVNYGLFLGCEAQEDELRASPWAMGDSIPASFASEGIHSRYYTADANPRARTLRALKSNVLLRIMRSIPSFKARVDHLNSRTWTDEQVTAALAEQGLTAASAEDLLSTAVGAPGLALLKNGAPRTFTLLALKQPGDPDFDTTRVGGCRMSDGPAPVSVSTHTKLGWGVLNIVDAGTSFGGVARKTVVDWGDGRVHKYFVGGKQSVAHMYAAPGTYTVLVYRYDASGLAARAKTTVVVTGAGAPLYGQSVTRATIDMRITNDGSVGTVYVDVDAIASDGERTSLGRLRAEVTPGPDGRARQDVTMHELASYRLTDVKRIELRPYTGGGRFEPELDIRAVTLYRLGPSGEVPVSFAPSILDARQWDVGATAPIAPKMSPEIDAIHVPIVGVQRVEIDIPADLTHKATAKFGCRPTYNPDGSVAPSLFSTADGGCKDSRNNLVWALPHDALGLPILNTNWHDWMWDRRVSEHWADPDALPPISATEPVWDYMKSLPQVGAARDQSPVALCHDLVQNGYSDWRVPRDAEVTSILGITEQIPYDVRGRWAWSPDNPSPDQARTLKLDGGYGWSLREDKTSTALIGFCVRDGEDLTRHRCRPGAPARFTTDQGGCYDNDTHVVWSRPSSYALTKTEAVQYCDDLVESDHDDWWAPTTDDAGATAGPAAALSLWYPNPIVWAGDYMIDMTSGGGYRAAAGDRYPAVCMRRVVPYTPIATCKGAVLGAGQALHQGETLCSPRGRYDAVLQSDGNFVVYDLFGGTPHATWASFTFTNEAVRVAMQTDCNLVVYLGETNDHALWHTHTYGNGDGCRLSMQDDGNLVLYRGSDGAPLWWTKG